MLALLILIGVLFSLTSLKYFNLPWVLITIFWLSIFIILTLRSKTTAEKSIWFNIAFVALLYGTLEISSYYSLNARRV